MTTIAGFELQPDAVPLTRLFDRYPTATIEIERVVPLHDRIVPYCWVTDTDGTDLENGFDLGKGIEHLKVVDRIDGRVLVRIQWAETHNGLSQAVAESDVTLLSARGTRDGWQIEVRGDDRNAISRFHRVCEELDLPIHLTTLHTLSPTDDPAAADVTDPQREALLLGYERGYYDTPRTTTLTELAEQLGVSRQAVAARLKRGTRALIEQSLRK